MKRSARVLILGAGGTFGSFLTRILAAQTDLTLIIAGRSRSSLIALQNSLQAARPPSDSEAIELALLDIDDPSFAAALGLLKPTIVIHCCGPFQGQDYRVALACLTCGSHYIDLADDTDFVCGIEKLQGMALERGVLLVSGASTVPALSSAVVDHFRPDFKRLDSIDYAISPGNQSPRGLATVAAILKSTGQRFPNWQDSAWQSIIGWGDSAWRDFGAGVGKRRVSNVPIPDLRLFPERYYPVKHIHFKAGLELGLLHNGMRAMAWLANQGVVKNWANCAQACLRISNCFRRFGSHAGAMQVDLIGLDYSYRQKHLSWTLIAENGNGPAVPAMPAAIVAQKIIYGELSEAGAMPCVGLFSLEELCELAAQFGIRFDVASKAGGFNFSEAANVNEAIPALLAKH